MSKYEGIIFDMDGLLFDTESIYYRASQKIADEMQFPYDEAYYLRFLGISDEELHENYYRDFASFGRERVAAFIQRSYSEVKKIFSEERIPLKKGALDLLQKLEKAGIPKVVASSNTQEFIEILLKNAELMNYFQGIVSADDVEKAKPAPEIIEKALTILELSTENALVLEDSINGIRAAHAANVDVIMVPDLFFPTGEAKKKTVAICENLSAAEKYIF